MAEADPQLPLEEFKADPSWYKDAVIYQLHVKSFFDANNDGIGDFAGLMQKLDHIADLGVTAIWLLPFYPSPRRDDGYDIADYYDVSPDYGTLEDFRAFVEAAHRRGIRVITELVINHTSDEHPWFQAARKAPPGSPERDFYVWSDDDEKYAGTRIIFCDTEKSNWSWDEEAGAYYWHRFYSHQPDLNFDNPRVLEEVIKVMHFWLDMGVDGLRLDAIPYLIEREGTSNENLPETHEVLRKIRADLDEHYPDRMLIAEANMWPEDTQQYFGPQGEECHMAFHFPLMPRMYMAVAQEDRFPITDIMRQTPPIPEQSQWAIFLRNHDELTLEMVTDAERDYLWETYAADRRARFNLGIRRRLAPLMGRDRRRIELMNALLLTMPGTPIIYYGDEIGMGDNIFLGDRDGVRTPMQWSPDRAGGFSRADPPRLALPPIQDPLYGYDVVNVESQERDSHSLLNWVKRMLAVRREYRAFGRGTQRFLKPRNRKVLAFLREDGEDTILCVANLASSAQAVELDLAEFTGFTPVELSGETPFPAIGTLPFLLTLPPYGFYWFRLDEKVEAPDWSSAAPSHEVEHHTFVLRPGLADVLEGENRQVLEGDILPAYIAERRWFGQKDEDIAGTRIARHAQLADDLLLAEVEVRLDSGTSTYALPFGIAWEGEHEGPFAPNLALARTRRGRHVGLLTDGFAVNSFPRAVIRAFRDSAEFDTGDGTLVFEGEEAFDLGEDAATEWLAAEQSNSTLILADRAVVKLLRRLQPGVHPEAEMTKYLCDLHYEAVAPFLGQARRVSPDGTSHTLMLAQCFVRNQGDGWRWTLDALERAALDARELPEKGNPVPFFEHFATRLGERLAEMHALLATPTEDPAFAPAMLDRGSAGRLAERVNAEIDKALGILERAELQWDEADTLARLKEHREELHNRITAIAADATGTQVTRIHGDLHLGQLLVAGDDVVFIDFEGEPARPVEERRAKDVPLRDVAGLLRSFGYAEAAVRRELPSLAGREQKRASELFDRFEIEARRAFCDAYAASAPHFSASLLDLFVLEKAAYEIAYEAANRPDWLPIPLAGLAAASQRLFSGESP
ncbi:maltose alpha-D-glucosyltransferase [Erythrobacter sp. HL-111]|uniref:maltose alpha-D-glucosyltransferase n=1 Tax=Erythrobacter sp. HL-111 TaxID=1798193 RepID=UPI0006DA8152|nr:maltose alpha-D-glucosyltransferase [Erythrobacter sp. HL-111]KPP88770.1 MAG: bifunctional maltose alpha-D-glucosyltransferase/ alpha-amylase TreS [Erythrobacteraceae bacterium HL-111]SDR95997.1 trehalose synthase [Erythrobacter sp. HL-111]